MSGEQDDASQPQPTGAGRWVRTREGLRFVADTLEPALADVPENRRVYAWIILRIKGVVAVFLAIVLAVVVAVITVNRTTDKAAKKGRDAEDAMNAKSGFVHATIRPQPRDAYDPTYSTFSEEELTPRQVEGINRGEYMASDAIKKGVAATPFSLGYGRASGSGQIYFVDLVSDSSAMVVVTDIRPVNIKCHRSKMIAAVETPGEGIVSISGMAYMLQDLQRSQNGFITDADDPNWGEPFFERNTITLGGGADAQTVAVLGVAKPGSYCTWDLEARFTTDDAQDRKVKINKKALVTEGGPGDGPGTQHLTVYAERLAKWACKHGQRKPEDCGGVS